MKHIFDRFIWIGLFILFIPTSLVMASWSSLPDEFMFPVKLTLENVLAAVVSPSYQVSAELQVKYTERRFADAQRLLAEKNSVVGLHYLTNQVAETKTVIERGGNTEEKRILTTKYIATLTDVSNSLESQKQMLTASKTSAPEAKGEVNTSNSAGSLPTPTPMANIPTPTARINIPSPTAEPVVTRQVATAPTTVLTAPTTPPPTLMQVANSNSTVPPTNLGVALQITQAQMTINRTIDELRKQDESDTRSDNGKSDKDNNSSH